MIPDLLLTVLLPIIVPY